MDLVWQITDDMPNFIAMWYCKWGKIRWAKHLRFQPYEVFHGNTFVVPWPAVFII